VIKNKEQSCSKGGNHMLLDAFEKTIFPYLVQIGGILFIYSIICSSYIVMRKHDIKELVEKLRSLVIGYMIIKGAFVILAFINKLIESMKV
jgi:hypothetical protein